MPRNPSFAKASDYFLEQLNFALSKIHRRFYGEQDNAVGRGLLACATENPTAIANVNIAATNLVIALSV